MEYDDDVHDAVSACSSSAVKEIDAYKAVHHSMEDGAVTCSSTITSFYIVGRCSQSERLKYAIKTAYGICAEEVLNVDLAAYAGNDSVAFILEDFDSTTFRDLRAACRIFGPTIVLECARSRIPLPKGRPLYCQSMKGVILSFSGLTRNATKELVDRVHLMGGSVRKDFMKSSACTHLVSNTTQTANYRLAIGRGRPVMSEQWIKECWDRRNDLFFCALNIVDSFKLKPFHNLTICFQGFTNAERTHMEEEAKLNGATIIDDPEYCSHVVIDTNNSYTLRSNIHKATHTVNAEWFWSSIQMNACANEAEDSYKVVSKDRPPEPSSSAVSLTVVSKQRSKSRRSSFFGRKSNVGTDHRLSVGQGSLLDISWDASSILADHVITCDDVENFLKTPNRCMSKRQQVCLELLQTENNYFQVLRTIMKIFKEPLENPNLIGGEILDPMELKLIFGRIPPIFEVHAKICRDLATLIMHWVENRCIGDVWLKYEEDLIKAYPPFVNFFEKIKETLNECDRTKPRFHAFLKVCQAKPECQRQSLQELLIRPVQRLPSVILLLNDLLKRTEKANADYQSLQRAIETLKGVLTHINKEKGRTEEQMTMFNIVNAIKNCPAHLLSSQRTLVTSVEVTELSNGLSIKGTNLTFYLFNDCLEVAETRILFLKQEQHPTWKHVELLFLTAIRGLISVYGSAEADNIFCLIIRDDVIGDKFYPFQFIKFVTKEGNKLSFLNSLLRQIAAVTGRVEFEVQEYNVRTSNNESELGRTVFKAVKRAQSLSKNQSLSKKLSRNISRPNSLQRAISQVVAWNSTLRSFSSRSNLHQPERQRTHSRLSTLFSPT